ncbi:MAG: hypothetical protein AB7N71_15035, partial [Phycisphaerae bacterium]
SGAAHDDRPSTSREGRQCAFIRYDRTDSGALQNPRAMVVDLMSRQVTPLGSGACRVVRFQP